MDLNAPLITVLMPVYNSGKCMQESIDSILNQTFKEFEFIIINEDPNNEVHALLDHYSQMDKRIQVYHQERQGLIASLNKGLGLAKGKYIARMDADDISLPKRLEKQVEFMESHDEVGVCGTWIKTIGCSHESVWKYPSNDERIRCEMFFNSAFAHPSVIIRRNLLRSLNLQYDERYRHAEDYDLWIKCSKNTLFANIGEILLLYRFHSDNVSNRFQQEQLTAANRVRLDQLAQLDLNPSEKEINLHNCISIWRFKTDPRFVKQVESWLCKIKSANKSRPIYPEPMFSRILVERWFYVCKHASGLGLWTLKTFWKSPIANDIEIDLKEKLKFVIASGISYHRADQ